MSCRAQLLTGHTHKALYWFTHLFKVYPEAVMFIHLFRLFLWDCSKIPVIFSKCKAHSFHFIGKQTGTYMNECVLGFVFSPFLFNVRFPFWKLWNIPCLPEKGNHLSHEMLMSRMSWAIFTVRGGSLESQSWWRVACELACTCLLSEAARFIVLAFVYSPSNYFWLFVDKDKWGD